MLGWGTWDNCPFLWGWSHWGWLQRGPIGFGCFGSPMVGTGSISAACSVPISHEDTVTGTCSVPSPCVGLGSWWLSAIGKWVPPRCHYPESNGAPWAPLRDVGTLTRGSSCPYMVNMGWDNWGQRSPLCWHPSTSPRYAHLVLSSAGEGEGLGMGGQYVPVHGAVGGTGMGVGEERASAGTHEGLCLIGARRW